MKYSLFLFDMDDTLLDFRASERVALKKTFAQFGIESKYDEFYPAYRAASGELWSAFEKNEITQDFLKVERFRRGLKAVGLNQNPAQVNGVYLDFLATTVEAIPGAEELCRELSKSAEIGIITNGLIEVQERRLQISPIAPYLSFVAISERCGHAKPDVRFFEYAVKLAKKPATKERILMVGDRADADIRGAQNFDACYFNPLERPLPVGIEAKYQIKNLSELLPLIV
jgi:2-haloacid dehalogenase